MCLVRQIGQSFLFVLLSLVREIRQDQMVFPVAFRSPSDDATRFVVLTYIVWVDLLLGIALRSTVLPLGSLLTMTEVCPVPLCALCRLDLPVGQFRLVLG